jgi:hypothetical protein
MVAKDLGVPDETHQRVTYVHPGGLRVLKAISTSLALTMLERDSGNVWDSRKVISDQSIQVQYGGPKLKAAKLYWWKVRPSSVVSESEHAVGKDKDIVFYGFRDWRSVYAVGSGEYDFLVR